MTLSHLTAARIRTLLCTLAAIATCDTALAQPTTPTIKPGEYIIEGGNGTLTVKPGKAGAFPFAIEVVGANAHTCSLEGELKNGKATLEADDPKQPCVVTVVPNKAGVVVKSSESGACRYYCGMRAEFEGQYILPSPACTSTAVAATRKSFKQLYDAKQFPAARAKLEPLLKECLPLFDWLTTGRIRNDLAVTLHKLGDLAGCRAVLQPLATDAAETDAQIREGYPPTDAEMYLPVVRATRTNLKLCREK